VRPIVAYQGVPGAFGEEACRRFLPDHEPVPLPSFAAVAEAVLAGEAELGMLPRVNSTAGPVPGMEDLLRRDGLAIRASHSLPVRLHLMARPGTALEAVTTAVSHPVALGQCVEFLAKTGLAAEQADNTAMAAQALAGPGMAAIASEAAASAYGLTILIRDVHDRPDNATTFCVVERSDGDQR
jgi:prephenate dehydratase